MEGRAGGARAGGAHARLDHARAFTDAADADGFAVEFEFHGDFFSARVAGHNRFGGVMCGGRVVIQFFNNLANTRTYIRHWQWQPNPAGGAHEHVSRLQQKFIGEQSRHFVRVLEPARAGAGVGVAGVDDHRLRIPVGDVLHTKLYWRGANLIGGKHPRRLGRHLGDDHGEVAFLSFVAALAGAEAFDITE